MRLAVIGCGRIGSAVGRRMQEQGWRVVGLRRDDAVGDSLPMIAGDAADARSLAAVESHLAGRPDLLLLSAAPGLRGGGDNRLEAAATRIAGTWPESACLQTSSTAVYADAEGADVDEGGRLACGARVDALLRIEAAVRSLPRHLVLRVGGLVGPGRQTIERRLQQQPCVLPGDPDRPFSFCHAADLVDVLSALLPRLASSETLPSLLNCVSPEVLSYRAYAQGLARRLGLPEPQIQGDDSPQPRRRVLAGRLQHLLPTFSWREAWAERHG